ncbi:MAG: DUF2752 domain-containing protein [Polyangiales bacterium]
MSRLVWILVASSALAVLITARLLTPASAGHGTHQALGLPPCGFLAWSGLPCPTCGLTTAFALLAHGEVLRAVQVQPMGVPLFLGTVATLGVAITALVRGDSILRRIDDWKLDRWALGLVIGLLTTWLARLAAL